MAGGACDELQILPANGTEGSGQRRLLRMHCSAWLGLQQWEAEVPAGGSMGGAGCHASIGGISSGSGGGASFGAGNASGASQGSLPPPGSPVSSHHPSPSLSPVHASSTPAEGPHASATPGGRHSLFEAAGELELGGGGCQQEGTLADKGEARAGPECQQAAADMCDAKRRASFTHVLRAG